MTMGKAVIYAVVAVALGYFLLSAVPEGVAAVGLRRPLMAEAEEAHGLGDEKGRMAEAEGSPRYTSGAWAGAFALGVWAVDLVVALGAYYAVKRRLT